MIYSKCPVCGSDDILRMRRITGYLTGSLESWNSAKQAEERERRAKEAAEAKARTKKIFTVVVCVILVLALGIPTMALTVLSL